MSTMYATITSKGQITLPATVRRELGLRAGQKVSVRIQDDSVVIDRPGDVAAVRVRLREEAQKSGTWGHVPTAGEGWSARAEDYRANS